MSSNSPPMPSRRRSGATATWAQKVVPDHAGQGGSADQGGAVLERPPGIDIVG